MLEQVFRTVVSQVIKAEQDIDALWEELSEAYSAKERHYHNLQHLQHMLDALWPLRDRLENPDAVVLALAYHDAVYDPLSACNEEDSAALAGKRLAAHHAPGALIHEVERLILATRKHDQDRGDAAYFTDADLCILGAPEAAYDSYANAIRQEYIRVPDALYIPGRLKVLEHFLGMPAIYKTQVFRERLETQARANLERERQSMSAPRPAQGRE